MDYEEKVRYLRGYSRSLHEINSILDRIDGLEALKYRLGGSVIKSHDVTQEKEKQLSIIGSIENLHHRAEKQLNELQNKLFEIEQSIKAVDNEIQQSILMYRYINDYSYKQIANKMYYSEDYIYVLHKKAIDDNEFIKDNGK